MPINRDTLIKALHCCSRTDAKASGCDACPLEYCGEDCNNLCEEAAVALEQMQWRSLDDEWPGDGDEVLVAPSLLTRHGYIYGAISKAYWDEENEQFRLLESAEYDVVSAKHWMPLPKLPELWKG